MNYGAADQVEVTDGVFEGYTGGVLWQRGYLVRVYVHGIHALTFHVNQLRHR